jgi:hypothetical protein
LIKNVGFSINYCDHSHKAQNEQLVTLKADADKLSTENVALMNGLRDQQSAAEITQAKITMTQGLIEKQQGINADLENQLAALQVKAKADEAARAMAAETAAKQAAEVTPELTPDELQSKVMDAYAKVKARGKFSDVWISDLQEQAGIEMNTLEAFLLKESREGRAVLSLGDSSLSLSTQANRDAAIIINGDSHLMVRFLEHAVKQAKKKPAVEPTPEVVVPVVPAVKSKKSGPVWKRSMEEVKAMEEKQYQKAYNALVDKNYHSQSVILVAKRKGTPQDVAEAENILAEHIAAGELTKDLQTRRYALESRLEGWDVQPTEDPDAVDTEVTPEPVAPEAIDLSSAFRSTLGLSADSPEQLRAVDVDRVMSNAKDRGYLTEFGTWLLSQPLKEGTMKAVKSYLDEVTQPVAPEPAAEPPAVTVAQDIISGKYDDLPLGDVLKLAGPVMDLDEAMYADLMDQVDAYTTVLTKKAVQAKFAE